MIVLIRRDRSKCILLDSNVSKVRNEKKIISISVWILFFKKSISSFHRFTYFSFSISIFRYVAYMSTGAIFIYWCNAYQSYPINPVRNKVRAHSCVIITWYHQTVRRSKTTKFFPSSFHFPIASLYFVRIFSTTPFLHSLRKGRKVLQQVSCVCLGRIFFFFVLLLSSQDIFSLRLSFV